MMDKVLVPVLVAMITACAGSAVKSRDISSEDCKRCPNFENQVGYLADPEDCKAFYHCQKLGVDEYIMKRVCCRNNLYWSSEKLTCVLTKASGCKDASKPCQAIAPETGPCSLLPSQDPRSFIQMVDGVGVLQNCPAGLVFHANACRCDWPTNPLPPKKCECTCPEECEQNVLLYYPFDQNVHDQSCTRAHSTNVGGVVIVKETRPSGVAYFSGSSKLEVPYMTNWFNDKEVNEFTIAVWVNNTGTKTGLQGLVGNGDCKTRGSVEMNLGKTGQVLYSFMTDGDGHVDANSGVTVSAGRWQHVAVVYNGKTVQVYKDGKHAGVPRPTTGNIQNRQCPLSIGRTGQTEGLGFFQGFLDELRLYQRALSSDEVAKLALQ